MPRTDAVHAVVREWVVKAENDLLNATHTLKLGRRCPTDTVCFHAQQCAEKYLKAVLVHRGIEVPKTHDLVTVAASLPNGRRLELSQDELPSLKRYATRTRYPGGEEIAVAEARHAVVMARRVRKAVRALLPREVLRRR